MDLIERYVKEVGRHLPRDQQTDVENELRSLLQDMVEDRAQTKVAQADEDLVADILLEFGHPKKVAASYADQHQYLIGPQLFPIFKLVLGVVTAVLGAMILVGVTLSARSSDAFLQDWLTLIVRAIPDFVENMLRSGAIIVIIFAVLERTLPAETFDEAQDETWDPRELPAVDSKKPVDRGELILGIGFSLFLLVLLNIFPQWAGVIYFVDDTVQSVALLSENFFVNILPWLNLSLVAAIIADSYKLYTGRQTRLVQTISVGATIVSLVAIYMLITRGPIFGVNEELMALHNNIPENFDDGVDALANLLNTLATVGLPILFLFELFSVGKQVYRLWQTPKNGSSPKLAGKPG